MPAGRTAPSPAHLGFEGSNPRSSLSILVILHAYPPLIAPQLLPAYLLPFPIWTRLYAPLFHVCTPVLFSPMWTAAVVTDTFRLPLRYFTCPGDPALLDSISSSAAELYFLSSIIISHCIPLACFLEPSGLYPAHPMWSPMLRCSFNPCSPRNPTDMSCSVSV